jgi:hypothetical protein
MIFAFVDHRGNAGYNTAITSYNQELRLNKKNGDYRNPRLSLYIRTECSCSKYKEKKKNGVSKVTLGLIMLA